MVQPSGIFRTLLDIYDRASLGKYLTAFSHPHPSFIDVWKGSKYASATRWILHRSKSLSRKSYTSFFLKKLQFLLHFLKPAVFSKSSKSFVIELAQESPYRFYLASFLESGILSFFSLSFNWETLFVKLLRSLCQEILLCKS